MAMFQYAMVPYPPPGPPIHAARVARDDNLDLLIVVEATGSAVSKPSESSCPVSTAPSAMPANQRPADTLQRS